MPYEARQKGEDWEVVNTDTKEVKAVHRPPDAKEKAERQIRLLEAIQHDPGWK